MSIADRGLDRSLAPEVEACIERMQRVNPDADPLTHLPDVDPRRIPRHVAIIMDGNGRWAEERGFPRVFGHRNGAIAVREVVKQAGRLGIEYLTLFSFSSENWRRPREEIDALMQLCIAYCQGEQEALRRRNIRVRVIGTRRGLPPEVVEALDDLERATAPCTGPTLCLAINYGARTEIVDAARALAREAATGRLDPDSIDEHAFARRLYTHDIPDPDLLIRTAGQMRVSNYLLWQISYAEIHVSDLYWPDFGAEALNDAVREFAGRDRRFGGLNG
ncbi:MAG: di-trans,poly-cis-decaprenylcistransferase [Phycisphaerales bacterium]|nr:di-trans,poly-cis-decaprenylcistransferase [Phycisphaerales bacterium]